MPQRSLLLLFGFCIFAGSFWLFPLQPVTSTDFVLSFSAAMALVCGTCGVLILQRQGYASLAEGWSWRLALNAVGALGAPAVLLPFGRDRLNSVVEVAVQAGVPIVVTLSLAATSDGGGSSQSSLLPAVVALAGTLLVLPVALPATSKGWTGLLLYFISAAFSGVCGVNCHRELRQAPFLSSAWKVAGANLVFTLLIAVGLVSESAASWHSGRDFRAIQSVLSVALDTVSISTLIGVLYFVEPLAAAIRFILIPLVAVAEAFILLRPTATLRTATGTLLMLVGTVACLRHRAQQQGTPSVFMR